VEFGAELTFVPEHGCDRTALTGPLDVRTAPELTLAVTEAHEQTPDDVFCLLDRVLDDRAGLFDAVVIDANDAVSDTEFVDVLYEYVATNDWDGAVHADLIDSYYDYDPGRLLVTPERYARAHPADEAPDTSVEASESS